MGQDTKYLKVNFKLIAHSTFDFNQTMSLLCRTFMNLPVPYCAYWGWNLLICRSVLLETIFYLLTLLCCVTENTN